MLLVLLLLVIPVLSRSLCYERTRRLGVTRHFCRSGNTTGSLLERGHVTRPKKGLFQTEPRME
jgi:hypothetical protein